MRGQKVRYEPSRAALCTASTRARTAARSCSGIAMPATNRTARASKSNSLSESALHFAPHAAAGCRFPVEFNGCSLPVPAISRPPGHPWRRLADFLRGILPRSRLPRGRFHGRRTFRGTCCNPSGDSGFCRFVRRGAIRCGRLLRSILYAWCTAPSRNPDPVLVRGSSWPGKGCQMKKRRSTE